MHLKTDQCRENILVAKFASLIRRLADLDMSLVNSTKSHDIYLMDNCLVFTLRGIYQLICDPDDITYTEFRTQLYQGNLNQQLGRLGYEVVITDSTGKIDNNWYQLRPLEVV